MNWLERAQREISENAKMRTANTAIRNCENFQNPQAPTANTAERNLTAVMAVPRPGLCEKLEGSIGSNGSTSPSRLLEPESVREAYEERAAIMAA